VAPYLTLLLNGAGWAPGFPRLLTNDQLPLARRLAAIGDISCDLGGGIEFVTRATTLSEPTFDMNGISVMSVDILPASLPMDASAAFAGKFEPYLRALVGEYRGEKASDANLERALARATLAKDGKIRKGFEWLQDNVDKWRAQSSTTTQVPQTLGAGARKSRVLVLGCGMVAGPAVNELAGRGDLDVIVGKCVHLSCLRKYSARCSQQCSRRSEALGGAISSC
jgi:alpha-aminoadipic semialdehyde synthase